MTSPADQQRDAAISVYTQYEPALYQGYLDMVTEWLAAVQAALLPAQVTQLALMPDPFAVFTLTPKWVSLVDQYTADVVQRVLTGAYHDVLGPEGDTVFSSRPYVNNYIADVANKLKNVPNEVFGLVQDIIGAATTNGASIPDVTKQIDQLFDVTAQSKWTHRAKTIARTEVVGAYNGGMNDAFKVLVDGMPEEKWVKRWLATKDDRTRPDHVEADGQVVPFGTAFNIGGYPMMHPGDKAGPAKEVVNCRCTMLLEIEGEPTNMDNRQFLSAGATGDDYQPFGFDGGEVQVTKRPKSRPAPTTVTKWTPGSPLSAGTIQREKLSDVTPRRRSK